MKEPAITVSTPTFMVMRKATAKRVLGTYVWLRRRFSQTRICRYARLKPKFKFGKVRLDWKANAGRRTDLIDVRDRIAAVLKSHSLDPETQSVVDSVLTITKFITKLLAPRAGGSWVSNPQVPMK